MSPLLDKNVTIANTGIQVSTLGLGTVKFGRTEGLKYPSGFKLPSDQQARALLDLAKDLGINLLDTAPAYGLSEARLGRLLKADRADWVLATKVGEEFEQGRSYFDFSPEHARFSLERSLKRLQTDFIDILMVHSDGNDLQIIRDLGLLDALAEFKRAGLIGAFGMSTKTVAGGLLAAKKSDVVMLTYNPWQKEEESVLDFAASNNTSIFIKKALASGHLIQHDQGKDPIASSFECIFAKRGSISIICGTINPAHLTENVGTLVSTLKSSVRSL